MPDDPIKHVIVLMLENRSFDHMLGSLAEELGLDGVPSVGPRRVNKDFEGHSYEQVDGAARVLKYDPRHEYEHVFHQLANSNQGFVDDFSRSYPHSEQADRHEIMKYHASGKLPALHALACNFTVCDRWFSSVPGPTWTNRFFVHTGTALGRVAMPNGILDANLHLYNQTTLYDRLNERKKSWKIYYGDVPQSLILVHQLEPRNAACYCKMRRFFEDAAVEKDFPAYAFIEPTYYPPGANDDHPPHDVLEGERLIAEVYNAIRANDDLWRSSLLIVLFDEHGGFYDHVEAPKSVPSPDNHHEEFTFDRLGVRVPAILVSPWVPKTVLHSEFDHTSLLRYLVGKWKLGPLCNRTARANTFREVFLDAARTDTITQIPGPSPESGLAVEPTNLIGRMQPAMSSQQSALFAMTQLVESATEAAPSDLIGRMKRIVTGLDGQVDVAIERVEQFFAQQRGTARSSG
jgi:phospholipase C